jgi:hypothetical protein
MNAFRIYEDYEDYLIVYLPEEINLFSGVKRMDFVYDSEYFSKLFADGWKILSIFHGQNKVTLYKP